MTTPELLPCPRCRRPDPTHIPAAYGFSEAVCCPCGIDFDGSPEEWNTRAPLSPAVLGELKGHEQR